MSKLSLDPRSDASGALVFGAAVPLAGVLAVHFLAPETALVNEPVHSAVEAFGAFSAVTLGILILLLPRQPEAGGRGAWVSSGLIGMGVLDGLHSAMPPGTAFVWLHSLATLVGGLFFAGVWLSGRRYSTRSYILLTAFAAASASILGLTSIFYSWALPPTIVQGYFSPLAISINIAGGIFFFAAAGKLLLRSSAKGSSDAALFATLCLLFGAAAAAFPFSQPWVAEWWFWHFLRLVAFAVALWYVFALYNRANQEVILRQRQNEELEERFNALLGQLRQFGTIFDSLNAVLYVADMQTHQLLYLNRYGADIFGADYQGRPCFEVLQLGQEGPCSFCTNDLLVHDGVPQPPHVWESQNTVNGRWYLCSDRAITWDDGRLVRMEVAVDITKRKRVEAELEDRSRLAALSADVGVALTQGESLQEALQQCTEALVRNMDAAFARIWVLNERENVLELQASAGLYTHIDGPHGRVPYGATMIGRIAEERQPHLINVTEGTTHFTDPEWARREGIVAFAGYPLTIEDRLVGVMGMFARHRLTDFTIQALGAVADVISLGIERKRAEKLREGFIHTISHDLRNPLTVVPAQAQFLQRSLARSGSGAREVNSAREMAIAAQRMNSLIKDLVDSARLESGQLQVEKRPTDLGPFIADFLKRSAMAMDTERVITEIPAGLPAAAADQDRLERILANLLSNALKYSPPEGEVLVKVKMAEGELMVSVTDRGAGIDPRDLPHIFERFYRPAGGRKPGGLGLGLHITRMLVEAHGGRIWLESEAGKGCAFYFTLPPS